MKKIKETNSIKMAQFMSKLINSNMRKKVLLSNLEAS